MDMLTTLLETESLRPVLVACARILFILVVARILTGLLKTPLARLHEQLVAVREKHGGDAGEAKKRADTLVGLCRQSVRVLIWATAGVMVLKEAGVAIGPIIASAGIVGLAVGFGAQNLVRDVISGFFIIVEDQIRVGDVAVINGTGGLVEEINLRTIVLRDATGAVHVFPNGTVSTLSNLTDEWSAHVFEIGVGYGEDTDKVIKVIEKVGRELKNDKTVGPHILEDLEVFGVDALGDSAVIIKGRIKTKPIQQWAVGREFTRRVKIAFDQDGIEIPFPQRTVHLIGEGLSGLKG